MSEVDTYTGYQDTWPKPTGVGDRGSEAGFDPVAHAARVEAFAKKIAVSGARILPGGLPGEQYAAAVESVTTGNGQAGVGVGIAGRMAS